MALFSNITNNLNDATLTTHECAHLGQTENPSETIHEECRELKTIQYKSMMNTGKPFVDKKTADMASFHKIMGTDAKRDTGEQWGKLSKTLKLRKMVDYVETYKQTHQLNEEEGQLMMNFLRESIDRKKLSKVKEVIYDKETGKIKDIPGLIYTKSTKHFTLKNVDKRVSTLKSLAPKKTNGGTIRKLTASSVPDSDEEHT